MLAVAPRTGGECDGHAKQLDGSGIIEVVLKLAAALLVMSSDGAAQNFAPDVLLLSRIKSHMREELAHLPNYTCLETTTRFIKETGRHSKMQPLDSVLLELVYSNHREWYGSPGDRNLSEDHPVAFIASGMIGNGAFAINLNNIFLSGGAIFTYRGEEALNGRVVARYDFRLPRSLARFEISIVGGSGTVGEEGTFWIDPQSLDLLRIESRTDEIPPFLPLQEMSQSVNYAPTRIGEYRALLAQQSDLHMVKTTGEESYNRLEFTHCRAFSAESTLSFDPEPQDAGKSPLADHPNVLSEARGTGGEVPALLRITVQLSTPITDKESVGALIGAKVYGDVIHKGKIIIPNGSLARGRIRRLERYKTGEDFIVGLEFTEVEVNGRSQRFYADLIRLAKVRGIRPTLSEQVAVRSGGELESRDETITLPELPGVASFFVHGNTFAVPSGFRMVWRTRGVIQ